MSELQLKIDGKQVRASEGETLLDVARRAGADIPTLCHHEQLEPFGGCRLCVVEARRGDWSRLVASCIYPAEDGLEITTRTDKIDRIRKVLLELQLAHAPHAPELEEMAEVYGAEAGRFSKDASFCIHCGLCVRYCAEVKGEHIVGWVDRGMRKEICFIPELAEKVCEECKECFPLCPTSYLQAAYVLTGSLRG